MTNSLFIDDSSFLGGGFGFEDYKISAKGLMELRSSEGGKSNRAIREEDIKSLRGEEADPRQLVMDAMMANNEAIRRPKLRPNPNRMAM